MIQEGSQLTVFMFDDATLFTHSWTFSIETPASYGRKAIVTEVLTASTTAFFALSRT